MLFAFTSPEQLKVQTSDLTSSVLATELTLHCALCYQKCCVLCNVLCFIFLGVKNEAMLCSSTGIDRSSVCLTGLACSNLMNESFRLCNDYTVILRNVMDSWFPWWRKPRACVLGVFINYLIYEYYPLHISLSQSFKYLFQQKRVLLFAKASGSGNWWDLILIMCFETRRWHALTTLNPAFHPFPLYRYSISSYLFNSLLFICRSCPPISRSWWKQNGLGGED